MVHGVSPKVKYFFNSLSHIFEFWLFYGILYIQYVVVWARGRPNILQRERMTINNNSVRLTFEKK